MGEQLTFDNIVNDFCGKREVKAWCCPECGKWLEIDIQVHECWRTGYTIHQQNIDVRTITSDNEKWEYVLAKLGFDPNGQRL